MTLDYKLTIRTESPRLGRGGALLEEVPEFVRVLEVAGVDSFHVAIGQSLQYPGHHPRLQSS